MIKMVLSKEEMRELCELILGNSHHFVRAKALVLFVKGLGISTKKTAESLGICENTVCNHLKAFLKDRMESVLVVKFYKPKSRLELFEEEIKRYLRETPPATVKQACMDIQALTQVHLKQTQMRKYLKSIGGIHIFRESSEKKSAILKKKEKETSDSLHKGSPLRANKK